MEKNLEMLNKDNKIDEFCGYTKIGIIKIVTSMKSNFEFLQNLYITDGKDF